MSSGTNRLSLRGLAIASAATLSGCGVAVPSLQEVGGDGIQLTRGITSSVSCELRDAVVDVLDTDRRIARLYNQPRNAEYFDNWGVQVGLTLAIEEKSSLSPSITYTRPEPLTRLFTIGGGVGGTASATRIDKINYFYTIKEIYRMGKCPNNVRDDAPLGSLLIRSDLKTAEWLRAHVLSAGTGAVSVPTKANTPNKQNALSHEIKFQVVTSGNVTPKLSLINTTFQPTSPLFTTSRDRTHGLIFTFGPLDPKADQLASVASGTFFAQQISSELNRTRGP